MNFFIRDKEQLSRFTNCHLYRTQISRNILLINFLIDCISQFFNICLSPFESKSLNYFETAHGGPYCKKPVSGMMKNTLLFLMYYIYIYL